MAEKSPTAKTGKKPAKQTLKEKRAVKREENQASLIKPRKGANG